MTRRSCSKWTLSANNAAVKIRNLLVSLAEKTAKSVASALVTFLVSSCLVGGAGYLLVRYGEESAELRKEITEFHISKTTFKRIVGQVKDMANVYHSGWFSNDRETQRLTDIVDRIPIDLRTNKLDVHFVKDSLLWSQEAITQLSQERGKTKRIWISR